MAKTITYDYTSIGDYLQGKMSPAEMHAFEKAMLDDPFLADALEGFRDADSVLAKKHLAEIERKINGEKQEAIVVPMATKGMNWLRVAAIVLILVTGSIFSYQFFQKDIGTGNEQQLANENPSTQEAIKDSIVNFGTEPSTTTENASPSIAMNKPKSPSTPRGTMGSVDNGKATQMDVADELPDMAMKEEKKEMQSAQVEIAKAKSMADKKVAVDDTYANRGASITNIPALNNREIRGNVSNSDGDPLAYAEIKPTNNTNSNAGTVADNQGNFSLIATDTVVDVSVKIIGYESKNAKISSNNASNKIVLREESQSLSEVVVTGMAKRNKAQSTKDVISSIANSKTAEPIGGWKKFENYLSTNTKNLKESFPTITKENLLMEFEIDNKGKPFDIKMVEPRQQQYESAISQLLINGPRWRKIKNNDKVKLELRLK